MSSSMFKFCEANHACKLDKNVLNDTPAAGLEQLIGSKAPD